MLEQESKAARCPIVSAIVAVLVLVVAGDARARDPLPEDAPPEAAEEGRELASAEPRPGRRAEGARALEERRWLDAHRLLSLALEEPLSEGERPEVQALLERALGHLGRLTVPAAPEGAVLAIDDAIVDVSGAWPAEPGTVVVSSGMHRFQIRLPDGSSATADSGVAGGEVGPLFIDLEELDEVAPAAAPIEDVRLEEASAEPSAAEPHFPAGWALFAVGLGTSAVGGVLLPLGATDVFAMEGVDISHDTLRNTLRGMGGAILLIGGTLAILGMVIAIDDENDDESTER